MLNILGVNRQEAKALSMLAKGSSYKQVSEEVNVTEVEAAKLENRGLLKLSVRWNKNQAQAQKLIKSFFVVVLCLLPSVEGIDVERALRVRFTRTKTIRRNEGLNFNFDV